MAQAKEDHSTPTRDAWAKAYAVQSQSDFEVYQFCLGQAAECHRLHYLQMACEKIAKAYRLRDTALPLENAATSHVAFSKFIDSFLTSQQLKQRYRNQDEKLRNVVRFARKLAREIERLAPAVDRNAFPANAEYPWAEGQTVIVPCQYDFPNLVLLKEPGAGEFLKLIKIAILDFDRIQIS